MSTSSATKFAKN